MAYADDCESVTRQVLRSIGKDGAERVELLNENKIEEEVIEEAPRGYFIQISTISTTISRERNNLISVRKKKK